MQRIQHYRILEKLGQGGMGVVYAAHDERLDRRIAIKTIAAASTDTTARERLWREARAAASVNHPNVCQIYEVGDAEGELFIAMELLEGEPLSARIAAGALPLTDAVHVALGVLAALDALGKRGLVHRDLKPSNIFLTPHGVKLLDFGLARPAVAAHGASTDGSTAINLTATGVLIGTPRYMAPELWSGEPARGPADIFALGAILFEMLAGRPAFGGASILEICRAISHEHPPALVGGSAAAAVDRVIHRALEKRPEDRYASADAMAQELRVALSDTPSAPAARVRPMTRLIALPFRVLRADPETDFLAYSVPDAITSSLSGLDSLVVRSSAAATRFAGAQPELRALASETEVDAALLGTLMRVGDQVRVSAQLVETPAGTVLWSGAVQLPLQDLFQLQDQLTRQIVESLALPLSARERIALEHDVPASARAYEFYLRANQIGQKTEELPVARDLYRSCLAEDPNYAPAWARLGRVYRVIAKYASGDVDENRALAAQAFRRALELNPDLPIAHNLYTYFEIEELGQAPAAMVRLLERAQSRPNDANLFAGLVPACRFSGLLDASIEADRRARRIDPTVMTSVSYTHALKGDWERALQQYDDPDIKALCLAMLGRGEEALEIYASWEKVEMSAVTRSLVQTTAAAIRGDRAACETAAAATFASKLRDSEAIYEAVRNLSRVGSPEMAMIGLRRAIEGGFYAVTAFEQDPWLASVRAHSDYAALLGVARAGREAAAAAYTRAGGERVLGVAAH
ncbi:MAG: protein kinase domain-containing protein [bacterium]